MTAADHIMYTERTLPFSPPAVYSAFATAQVLSTWGGPDGFTNSFEVFDFGVGGDWIFHMIGPDGTRHANKCIFAALEPASRLVIRHDCAPYFSLTVTLTPVDGGTRLTWQQTFDDVQVAQAVKAIVEPANEQNLDRLTRALERV
jgi:uncharacterized protein YndB with AHSA1/START domain